MTNKISIVTVVYNRGVELEETINSVIMQTYSNYEYIIIDGGSTDNTLNIIEKYNKYISKSLSEPDNGIFDAMNKALNYVSGDYTIFINAGDRFVSNDILANIFADRSYDEDLIYGDVYIRNNLGYLLSKAQAIYSEEASAKDLVFKGQGICHQALFTKSSVLKEVKFNLDYPLGADYDTTAKVNQVGNTRIKYVGFPVSVFDDRFGGASHNQIWKVLNERAQMFKYYKGVWFYYLVYWEIAKSKVKSFLGFALAPLVVKYRKRKYLNEI